MLKGLLVAINQGGEGRRQSQMCIRGSLYGRRLQLRQGGPVAAPDRLEAVPRVSRKVLSRKLLPAEEGSGHPRVGFPQSLDHSETIPNRPLHHRH